MTKQPLHELPKISYRVWKVWRRDLEVFLKMWKVNFLPPAIEPILYLLAFGLGLGSFVTGVGGHSYAQFFAPALLAITIMNSAFFECTYSSFVRMYYQKTFDAIVATPLNIDEVIAGELLWGATRSTISASIMLVIIGLFNLASFPAALIVIPFSFLGGLLFASLAMCFTAVSPDITALNYPTSLFITPMFLVSGTFFPLTVLPVFIQQFSTAVLPLLHVVNLCRAMTYGQFTGDLIFDLIWILVVAAVFFIICINLMKRRLIV